MSDKLPSIDTTDTVPDRSIRQWLRDNRIDEIEAVIPDMTGIARGKLIPAHKYSEEIGMRLPEAIFLQTVTGEYPEDQSAVDLQTKIFSSSPILTALGSSLGHRSRLRSLSMIASMPTAVPLKWHRATCCRKSSTPIGNTDGSPS